jgi:hypothetical protein
VNLGRYLCLLDHVQEDLAAAFNAVGDVHAEEPDVRVLVHRFAQQCEEHRAKLAPLLERYASAEGGDDEGAFGDRFAGPRLGALGLLRDLQDLYVMASEVDITWTLVGQAAQGARDDELEQVVKGCETETSTHLAWLRTRLKQAAPQALVVA